MSEKEKPPEPLVAGPESTVARIFREAELAVESREVKAGPGRLNLPETPGSLTETPAAAAETPAAEPLRGGTALNPQVGARYTIEPLTKSEVKVLVAASKDPTEWAAVRLGISGIQLQVAQETGETFALIMVPLPKNVFRAIGSASSRIYAPEDTARRFLQWLGPTEVRFVLHQDGASPGVAFPRPDIQEFLRDIGALPGSESKR